MSLLATLLLSGCAHGTVAPAFTLTEARSGAPWSLADHPAPVVLVFGYTHCTDTCPLTLANLTTIARSRAKPRQPFTVAFITVDPRRDTPAVLNRFLARFASARLVGLTGTPAQIAAIENAYHVWAKVEPATATHPYRVAHGTAMIFLDRGRIAGYGDENASIAGLRRSLTKAFG